LSSCDNLPDDIEVEWGSAPFTRSMCNGSTMIALPGEMARTACIVLRSWEHGDRFTPFGMQGSKLLSDLFTDLHLNALEKERALVLEVDGQIAWVIGYRAAAITRVDEGATDYCLLRKSSKDAQK